VTGWTSASPVDDILVGAVTVDAVRHSINRAGLAHGLRPDGRTLVWLGGVALAAVVGASAALAPLIAVLGAGAMAFGLGLIASGTRSQRRFLLMLAGLLVGYAFFSRGFAYLGVRPLFVGDVVLVVGVWAFLRSLPRAHLGLPSAVIVLFMAWGALRTIPYLGVYGIDALRDGVTWGYAAFALFVGAFATRRDVGAVVNLYARLLPVFLLWVPVATALNFAGIVPTVPGTSVPIIGLKQGDMGVQLAGIAAFMLTGLYGATRGRRMVPESVAWLVWFPVAAIVAAQNRGAMLAMSVAGLALFLVRPSTRVLRAFVLAVVVIVAAIALNPAIDIGDRRSISVTQVISNITSVFGATGNEDLDGSRTWRLAWWDTIVHYTVDGPYFWTGKGFGINLADADGFQIAAVGLEDSLRAPHNGHLEILARTGVPGFGLWVLLNAVWLLMMLRALVRFRRANDALGAGVIVWLTVLWGAALVNASFDVYLQGPHGGIWFWSVVGLGIALARGAPVASDLQNGTPELAARLRTVPVLP
jgi:hypothetical protein